MELAKHIEHTLLSPICTSSQIEKLCAEAQQYGFAGVCVPPFYVRHAAYLLDNSPVRVVTVAGFPMGYSAIPAKIEEIKRAVDEGVDEIDIVANICAIKDNKWAHVHNDLDSAIRATHLHGKTAKIIIEAALLTDDEIRKVCQISVELGANFVKTSTGINGEGATLHQVQTIRQAVQGRAQIKASGGIRSYEQALQFLQAGAERIGTSAGVAIVSHKSTANK